MAYDTERRLRGDLLRECNTIDGDRSIVAHAIEAFLQQCKRFLMLARADFAGQLQVELKIGLDERITPLGQTLNLALAQSDCNSSRAFLWRYRRPVGVENGGAGGGEGGKRRLRLKRNDSGKAIYDLHRRNDCRRDVTETGKTFDGADKLNFGARRREMKRRLEHCVKAITARLLCGLAPALRIRLELGGMIHGCTSVRIVAQHRAAEAVKIGVRRRNEKDGVARTLTHDNAHSQDFSILCRGK